MDTKTLKERQGWTLSQKIDHSLGTIDQFIQRMDGKVYVSFSGGKDSTVLYDLCRIIKPDIQAIFVNTGCEYPDIIRFVNGKIRCGCNILIIKPKLTPRQVWSEYGFPLVSKETSCQVHSIRINPSCVHARRVFGDLQGTNKFALARKWQFLLDEDFETTNICCAKLKKEPVRRIAREMGLFPIVGTMASESALREKTYVRRGGCNVFGEHAESLPLSIWNEQDVWDYIKMRNLEIADIYRKGAKRTGCTACGFGCQYPDDERFALLYRLYPKYYEMVMNFENNGVKYREAVRKVMAVNGLKLPDE